MIGQTWAPTSWIHAGIPIYIRWNRQSERAGPPCQCKPDVVDPATLLGILGPGVVGVAPGVVLGLVAMPGGKPSFREVSFQAVHHQSPVLPWKLVDSRVRLGIEVAAEDLNVDREFERIHL